ncbi:hypothetical protein O0L34_g2452 [Tuta absoluta]|nr:hypothetical protein O0L34_g2452 [Tuta absoluta]
MATVEENDNASGDKNESKLKVAPEPEPPKPPDVELIVDGFGFMPKSMQSEMRRQSNIFDKSTKRLEDIMVDPEESRSPCASSTNIDIVRRYTWKTKNRMIVQVITYGATITSVSVPDRKGVPDDILAGFDTLEEYFQDSNPYFGATIGRCANVITDGTMIVRPSGRVYMLSSNKGYHHYNGGYIGFDKVNWRSYVSENKVIMSHVSERFTEGYPGTVMAQITFEVTCDNTIKIEMKCTTSEPTVVNLSHAPFFNLAGHNSGPVTLMDHMFTINADKYTAVDENGIVTGEKKVVGGTAFDFRVPRVLKCMLPKIPMGGYDINFCVTQGTAQDLTFQGRALHPGTGRVLEVYSNQPGVQFYTGNLLPDPDKIVEIPATGDEEQDVGGGEIASSKSSSALGEEAIEEGSEEGVKDVGYVPLVGKGGAVYKRHGLFCFMPQNYPDAINHRNFPNAVLNPGEVYVHRIQYKFGLLLGKYV